MLFLERIMSEKVNMLVSKLFDVYGHHPDAAFIKNFVNEQRASSDFKSEADLYIEIVDFLIDRSLSAHREKIINLNNTISEAINELAVLGEWSNLSKIAEHAMREHVKILKAEKDNSQVAESMIDGSGLRLKTLTSSDHELKELFKNMNV